MAGLAHVTNLSIAAELELAETTRITAGLYRVFGDQITQATDSSDKFRIIVDSLAATLNQSQVDMDGLVAGLGYLINEGDAAGLSMNQVLGVLSVLNNRLLLGSKAGRSASRVLTQLTSNADKLAESFNLKIDFTKPLDLIDILEQLNVKVNAAKVNGQITVETFAKLQDVFGQIGKRAAIGLIENIDELKTTIGELETDKFTDLTEQMAEVKLGTFEREMKRLSNTFKVFLSDVLSPMINQLENIAEVTLIFLGGLAQGFEGFREQAEYTRLKLLAVYIVIKGIAVFFASKQWILGPAVFQALGFAASFVLLQFKRLFLQLTVIGPMIKGLLALLGNLVWAFLGSAKALEALNRQMLAFRHTAIGIVVAGLIWQYSKWAAKVNETKEALGKANKEFLEAETAYKEASDSLETFAENLKKVTDEYEDAIPFTRKWYDIREKIRNQYPGLLEDMDAHIIALDDTTAAIENVIAAEEKRLGLEFKQRNQEATAADLREVATTRAIQLMDKVATKAMETQFEGGFLNRAWGRWLHSKRTQEAAEEAEEMLQAAKSLQKMGLGIPKELLNFAKLFTGIGDETLTLHSYADALMRISKDARGAMPQLISLKAALADMFGEEFVAGIDLSLGIENVDTKALHALGVQIKDQIEKNIGAEDVERGAIQDYKTRVDKLKLNVITNTRGMVTASKEGLAEFRAYSVKYVKELENLISQDTLSETGIGDRFEAIGFDARHEITKSLMDTKSVLNDSSASVQELKESMKSLSDVVIILSKETDSLFRIKFRGAVNEITNILTQWGTLSSKGASKALEVQYAKLSEKQREIFKEHLGSQADDFFEYMRKGQAMSSNTLEAVTKSTSDLVTQLGAGFSKGQILMLENIVAMEEGVDKLYNRLHSTERLMEILGQGSTKLTQTLLTENQQLFEDTAKYLPQYVNDMISKASVLEKAQLVKMINDIEKDIKAEAQKLGIELTPEVKTQLAIQKYSESYDEMQTAASKFYEKALEEGSQYVADMTKQQLALEGSTVATILNTNKLRQKTHEINKKYQKEELILTAQLEATKRSVWETGDEKHYKEIYVEVEKYTEQIKKANKAMAYSARAVELVKNAQTRFKATLFDPARQDTFIGLLNDNVKQLESFLVATDRTIENKFRLLLESLQGNQQIFLQDLMNETLDLADGDIKLGLEHLQKIIRITQQEGMSDVAKLTDELTSRWEQSEQSALDRRNLAIGRQLAAQAILDTMNTDYAKTEYRNNAKVNAVRLKQMALQNRKQHELLVAEREIYLEHYKEMKSLRDKELSRLEEYANVFANIFTGEELQENIDKRMEIIGTGFTENVKMITKGAADTSAEIKRIDDLISAEAASRSVLTLESPGFAVTELGTLEAFENELKKQLEAIKRYEEELKQIKLSSYTFSTTMEKLYDEQTQRQIDVKKETLNGAKVDADRIKKIIEDSHKTTLEANQKAHDQNIEQYKKDKAAADSLQQGYAQSIANLPQDMNIIYAKYGEGAIKSMFDAMKRIEEENIDIFATIARAKGKGPELFTEEQIQIAENEATNRIKGVAKRVLDAWEKLVDQIGEQQGWGDKLRKFWKAQMVGVTEYGVDASTEGMGERFRSRMVDELSRVDLNIDAAKTILNVDATALVEAGGSLEAQKTLQQEINRLEDARNDYRKLGIIQLQNETTALLKQRGIIYGNVRNYAEQLKIQTDLKTAAIEQYGEEADLVAIDAEIARLRQLIVDLEKDEADLLDRQKKAGEAIAKIIAKQAEKAAELRKITALTADSWSEFFDGFEQGAKDAWKTWSEEATNASKIAGELINGLLNGMTAAVLGTMEALFVAPEEEINAAEEELEDLLQKRKDIEDEMNAIGIGGPSGQEDELKGLTKQYKEINKEIETASANLDELGDTSKRVGAAWKKFGADMLKMLGELILKLTLTMIITQALQGLGGGLGGRAATSEGLTGTYGMYKTGFATGGIVPGGFIPIDYYAKGGVIQGGLTAPEKGRQDWLNFVKYSMGATLLAGGGIIGSPTLGLVGEGSQNEAVVPLPDNRSIPVKFVGEEGKEKGATQDVQIMNIVDPAMIPSVMMRNPDIIVNIISEDINKRGPMFHIIKQVSKS